MPNCDFFADFLFIYHYIILPRGIYCRERIQSREVIISGFVGLLSKRTEQYCTFASYLFISFLWNGLSRHNIRHGVHRVRLHHRCHTKSYTTVLPHGSPLPHIQTLPLQSLPLALPVRLLLREPIKQRSIVTVTYIQYILVHPQRRQP